MNKDNLKKLADWLEENVTENRFDMAHFRSNGSGSYAEFISLLDCGTAGCALGWAPFVPGLGSKKRNKNFWNYGAEIFDLDSESYEWDYIFSSFWRHFDNSIEGAINRIREVVNGKEIDYGSLPWRR